MKQKKRKNYHPSGLYVPCYCLPDERSRFFILNFIRDFNKILGIKDEYKYFQSFTCKMVVVYGYRCIILISRAISSLKVYGYRKRFYGETGKLNHAENLRYDTSSQIFYKFKANYSSTIRLFKSALHAYHALHSIHLLRSVFFHKYKY